MDMTLNNYWAALSRRQQAGFGLGVLLIIATTVALAVWALRDPWVIVAREVPADRLVTLGRELARDKLEHRVGDDGASIEVRQSSVGRARAAAATGGVGLPPNVGLEIFKETDFSTTDFAQRINYQRALQGELTRTLQTMAGVRQARVHVVLPEGGVLKRGATKASAAVTLALQPGKTLTRSQVRGVQRLVASSVPEIKADDVVVLDESGASLVRDTTAGDTELSGAQLDMKRQVDGYLESKLTRLLEEILPGVQVSLSVDTVLDYKQLKVTIEEPIATPGPKDAERSTGVVVRERQVTRTAGGTAATAAANAAANDSMDLDIEYKVGHRVEQSLLAPGTIRRISVAVAVHGAPAGLAESRIEQLVSHAVGVDRQRGDSVMVMMFGQSPVANVAYAMPAADSVKTAAAPAVREALPPSLAGVPYAPLVLALLFAAAIAWFGLQRGQTARAKDKRLTDVAQQVRQWLGEDHESDRR
jgi:flagellar M-ring protein FliF